MRVVENKRRKNGEIRGSHPKHRREMKKMQAETEKSAINRRMGTRQHSLTELKRKICHLTYALKIKTQVEKIIIQKNKFKLFPGMFQKRYQITQSTYRMISTG